MKLMPLAREVTEVAAHDAHEEAARKLITNHEAVVRDVTNPNPKSQRQLQRVTEAAAPYVDQMLREVARRLLGRRPALQELEETLDPSVLPVQVEAWAVTARYLRARTQAVSRRGVQRARARPRARRAARRRLARRRLLLLALSLWRERFVGPLGA